MKQVVKNSIVNNLEDPDMERVLLYEIDENKVYLVKEIKNNKSKLIAYFVDNVKDNNGKFDLLVLDITSERNVAPMVGTQSLKSHIKIYVKNSQTVYEFDSVVELMKYIYGYL